MLFKSGQVSGIEGEGQDYTETELRKVKVGRNRWGWPKYEWQHVPVEKHELSDLDSQGDLEVKGSVDNANASADATTDNASARATLADNIGVDLNGAAGLHNAHASITSGGDMDVAGSAALNADASATGVDEDAHAEVQVDDVKGIDTTVDLKAKGDALLNGSAAATTNVSASSTGDGNGPDSASATSAVNNVIGIDAQSDVEAGWLHIDSHGIDIEVKGDLEASGSANASQTAMQTSPQALVANITGQSVIGAHYDDNYPVLFHNYPDGLMSVPMPTSVAMRLSTMMPRQTAPPVMQLHQKISNTTGLIDDLNVGGDAAVSGSASVTGVASATTVEGVADADSGNNHTDVTGYDVQGRVGIGGDATIAGVASSSNTATAVSTKGAATADSGQDEVTGIVLDREDMVQRTSRHPRWRRCKHHRHGEHQFICNGSNHRRRCSSNS